MLTTLLTVLVVSQVQVYVVDGVPADVIARSEICKGRTCLDATAVHSHLFPSTMLDQDYESFTAAPMKGWPTELDAQWKEGVAKCRALAGPPPWKSTAVFAFTCGKKLSETLWGAWLTHRQATRVAVFTSSADGKARVLTVRAYEFPARHLRVNKVRTDAAGLEAALLQLAQTSLKPEGLIERFISPPLPEPVSPTGVSRLAGKEPSKLAVPDVKSCDAAPASLVVNGTDPLSTSVAARWSASVKGKGDAATCTLSETARDEDMVGTVITATVTCGEVVVATQGALLMKDPVEMVSARLVKNLAAQWCR